MNRGRVANTRRPFRIQAIVFALLAAGAQAACGGSASTGSSSSTPTPAAAATSAPARTPATAKAPCTVAAAMAAVKLVYDKGGTVATVAAGNGDLRCASGIARIGVHIGPKNPPANGPQGVGHLALLEDRAGTWVVANDQLCNGSSPTRPIPASLGTICGIQ